MNSMITTLVLKRWSWAVPLCLLHVWWIKFVIEMLLVMKFVIRIQSISKVCNNTIFLKQKLSFCFLSVYIWASTWQNQQCGCAPSEDSDQPGHLSQPALSTAYSLQSMFNYAILFGGYWISVGDWLQIAIVALPGPFVWHFTFSGCLILFIWCVINIVCSIAFSRIRFGSVQHYFHFAMASWTDRPRQTI